MTWWTNPYFTYAAAVLLGGLGVIVVISLLNMTRGRPRKTDHPEDFIRDYGPGE